MVIISFEAIFFEKSDLQKFDMFRTLTIYHSASLSISDLASKLSLSYQQSYNIFQELVQDLMDLTDESRATCKKSLSGAIPMLLNLDDYRTYLLQDAIAFQFIDYLVQGNRPSVDFFCSERYISRSTLMRKTAPVRTFLADFKVKLSLTKAGFMGDEKQVRLFLQQFYWLSYHGTEWPFQAVNFGQLEQQYAALPTADADPLIATQECIFWAICRLRMAHGHYVRLDAKLRTDFRGFPLPLQAVYHTQLFPSLSESTLEGEAAFFYFYQQKMIRFTATPPLNRQVINFIKHTHTPIWPVVKQLGTWLQASLKDPADTALRDDEPLQDNLIRTAAAFFFMGGDYIKQPDFNPPDQITYEQTQIREELRRFIASLPDTPAFHPYHRASAAFIRVLFYLLVPYLRRFHWDNTVKVKLVMETTDIIHRDIISFLRNLNVVTLLPDAAPVASADVLITAVDDFVDPVQLALAPQTRTFNWYLDATKNDYYSLFTLIAQTYRTKLASNGEPAAG